MKFYWSCAVFSFKSINTYGFFWSENKQAQIEGSFLYYKNKKANANAKQHEMLQKTHISQNTTNKIFPEQVPA